VVRTGNGLVVGVLLLAATACGDPATVGEGPPSGGGEGAAAGSAGAEGDATVYDCHGVAGTAAVLTGPPDLDEHAGHPGYETFLAEAGERTDGWVVTSVDDEHLSAVRELDEPEQDAPDLGARTHERLEVRLAPAESVVASDEDVWMLWSAGPCALQAQLDGLGSAVLTLAATPAPDDTEVALEVYEQACASGRSAEDRVRLVDLEVTDDQVRLVIGVEPLDGAQTCPSNPPTPMVVELPEPVGDREVVDAGVLPPRPLGTGGSPW
jgi:hypothetical protein